MQFENQLIQISFINTKDHLWQYKVKETGKTLNFAGPTFEVDGKTIYAYLEDINMIGEPVLLSNGCTEYTYGGCFSNKSNLFLEMTFRVAEDNPVVRFRYKLKASSKHTLTKSNGVDRLDYLSISFKDHYKFKEVRFSEYNEMIHSFCLSEIPVKTSFFQNELSIMGPMLTCEGDNHSVLIAYEHGSQVPDQYLGFQLNKDFNVKLSAVKGNYYNGHEITSENFYQTIWLQVCIINGGEDVLAQAYRTFVLKYFTLNTESRKPYIFYNTWAYQERNKHWNGKKYLDSINLERILNEIDIAHQIGIEVYVIDTGWYEKTGDWIVNSKRFPDGIKKVKEKLDSYDMKLGLWFDPQAAAVSSKVLSMNKDFRMEWKGKECEPHEIWESEESYKMCLVSSYWESFADELIRLVNELGVTYFKWDAIAQYGCDSSNHDHGNVSNSQEERADCYAFQIGLSMSCIVDKLCKSCPQVIVDFDVTEGNRYMGLGFLSSGKYFLLNNGPYYENYNLPTPDNQWSNIFVYSGCARGWICRTPLDYDKWIPSVLFLTHYLPDDPVSSQIINIASLILGQNGIWGDLMNISTEGKKVFSNLLGMYKEVRDDLTSSSPVRSGKVGTSPEIHEKINSETGRGAIIIFSNNKGTYTYISTNRVTHNYWCSEGVSIEIDREDLAKIKTEFKEYGAKIIFFGV